MKKLLQILALVFMHNICFGQLLIINDSIKSLNEENFKLILKKGPAFSMYRDNYFITGTRLGETPTKNNSDAKFQFSFKQRLLNKPIGQKVYFFLTYTQKSFWDIYADSRPFKESNYNPALLFVMPTFKNDNFKGAWTFTIEHESNGRDSIYSRSWNFISLGYGRMLSPKLVVGLRAWIPFVSNENPDLIEYIGYGEGQIHWTIKEKKLYVDCAVRKGASSDWKGSIQTSISYTPFTNKTLNLMLQWWQGYAESLVDYKENKGMLRFGLQLTPSYFRLY